LRNSDYGSIASGNKTVTRLPDGSKYTGELLRGKPHGKGTIAYRNGDFFKGNFINGKRHG